MNPELLLLAHYDNVIDDEKFLILHDMHIKQSNLELPFWKYDKFNLESMENDECISEFRFEKEDIPNLKFVM